MLPHLMKNRFMAGFGLGLVVVMGASSGVRAESRPARDLLKDLETLSLHCVVQPFQIDAQGHEVRGALKSLCAELVQTPTGARAKLDDQDYSVSLAESAESDDGDLDDLRVQDAQGRIVATRKNVAAFGSVFLAMTAGRDEFREQRE